MRVSVVIPVFNKAPYLKECLESVFSQTYSAFEVIAVDDRSTDGSLAILRSFQDPRLRVVALERNMGPSGAAQRAMDLATGEYIVRVDADDILVADRIARQVEFMDSDPTIGASGGRMEQFGDEARSLYAPEQPSDCMAQVFFGVPIAQPSCILRTSVLRDSGVRYMDEWPRIGEDWLFFIALSRYTSFANMDRPLVHYRKGVQNISYGQDMVKRWTEVARFALPMLGLEPSTENITLHLLTKPAFVRTPDRALVRNFRRWVDDLKQDTSLRKRFPDPSFAERLERAWNVLYPRLCDHAAAPALEHMRLSGRVSLTRLIYLFKVRLRAWRTGSVHGVPRSKSRV